MNAVLGALLGFVIGQIVKFVFEPVYRLREWVGRVDFLLGYYSNVYMNPRGLAEGYSAEAQKELRTVAFELRAKAAAVVWLPFFSAIKLTPSESAIYEASKELTGLSNSLRELTEIDLTAASNKNRRDRIVKVLGLRDWTNRT